MKKISNKKKKEMFKILSVKEIQIKTTLRSDWLSSKSQVTADAGEDVVKEEHSSIAGGIVSLYNHCGKQSGGSSESWT